MATKKSYLFNRRRMPVVLLTVSISQFLLVFGYINSWGIYSSHSHKTYMTRNNPVLISLGHRYGGFLRGILGKGKSKLCLSPYILNVDENLKSLLEERNMLSYFRNDSNYIVSVPKWQLKLNHQRQPKRKYFLTAVLRVRLYVEDKAKWTIRELKQWLHYQFWAGAEHVYICNHYLHESERIDVHLQNYIKLNLVTIYPWNHVKAIPGTDNYHNNIMRNQIMCYTHIVKVHGHESVWQYSLDMDEIPYVVDDSCEGFLPRYVRTLNNFTDQVRMENFVLQGQGDRSRDLIYERIIRISPKPYNDLKKPLYKVSHVTNTGIHSFSVTGETIIVDPEKMKMLHYWGARTLNWGNDTAEMIDATQEFLDVRQTIAINIRHSLIAFHEYDAFSSTTGP